MAKKSVTAACSSNAALRVFCRSASANSANCMSAEFAAARRVADIDWKRWRAVDTATLVFVLRGDEILLIDKKRGLGKGKVNGPGGKVDPGETVEQCAIRECQEELAIEVSALEVLVSTASSLSMATRFIVLFTAPGSFIGTPTESPEAAPRWTRVDDIPYDLMWEDDRIWLPMMLAGKAFRAKWIFDEGPDGRLPA